jgi:broad-specificity NMP kinase
MATQVLLIGGRSGSGKTQAASELHALLAREDVRHAVIEGDYLDLAHPTPWEHHLAERNLAAVWANYRELGYERLIYSNTIAPLQAAELAAAMGDDPVVTAVVLSASNDTVYARLAGRESGAELLEHLRRSEAAAARLDEECTPEVIRIDTNSRTSPEVVEHIRSLLPW